MSRSTPSGTEGYAEEADALFVQYETIALAGPARLSCNLRQETRDGLLKRPGVWWHRLAFAKA